MSSDLRRFVLVVCCTATAVACFDPLYGEGDALGSTWVICCPSGEVSTCLCTDPRTCGAAFVACPGGTCGTTTCSVSSDGGEPLDAGQPLDGGAADAGPSDGGPFDAGPFDGGDGDAGVADTYEFCCRDARLTTCLCPAGVCAALPFTPCAGATCVEGTSAGHCP